MRVAAAGGEVGDGDGGIVYPEFSGQSLNNTGT